MFIDVNNTNMNMELSNLMTKINTNQLMDVYLAILFI